MQEGIADRKSTIDPDRTRVDTRPCVPGYLEREFKHLEMQSAVIGDLTEDVLQRAGVAHGMSVLDLGCGVGDVSLLAGWLVGPSGFVLGVDPSAGAVATAERRAAEAGQRSWVQFTACELDRFEPDRTFDAIIGRLVLMYLPEPAATLRRLSAHLRPGGIVAFQEATIPLARSIPAGRQFGRCTDWITAAIACSGFQVAMGDKLFATFLAAGLPAPRMIAAAHAAGGAKSWVYDYLAETARRLLPAMERAGVATAAEVDIDTLAERLRREAVGNGSCIMLPPMVGAWVRKSA